MVPPLEKKKERWGNKHKPNEQYGKYASKLVDGISQLVFIVVILAA